MRAVNLLPQDDRPARLEGRRTPLLVALGGFVLVSVGAFLVGHSASSSVGEKKAALESVNAQIAKLPKAQRPVASSSLISQERSDRIAALSAALSTRIPFDGVLRQISIVLPQDAWLTGLAAAAPAATTTPTGTSGAAPTPTQTFTGTQGVTIEGATFSKESVARVLSRLAIVPTLENVR